MRSAPGASLIAAPFKRADLRDLERVVAALDRIKERHGEAYDDYEFDPINLVRSAAVEAIRGVTGE